MRKPRRVFHSVWSSLSSTTVTNAEIDVRFSDLDAYGHVNSRNYLDYILSARILFMERELKMKEVTDRGIGFFLKKVEQNFKRPISGVTRIRGVSYVQEVAGSKLKIPFRLEDADGGVYSDGVLDFAVVDMITGRPVDAPEWVLDFLFCK